MKCIEIIATPDGEAPEDIRKCWIGIVIQLPGDAQIEQERAGYGVLSGPRSWVAAKIPFLYKRKKKRKYYLVNALAAVDALAKKDESAAGWWRQNTPHLLDRHWRLMFPAEVCRVTDQSAQIPPD